MWVALQNSQNKTENQAVKSHLKGNGRGKEQENKVNGAVTIKAVSEGL